MHQKYLKILMEKDQELFSVTERGLKREYVHAPLHSVCGMAVPQLVWVNVETGGSSPLPANISNRLSSEMSLCHGDSEIHSCQLRRGQAREKARACHWTLEQSLLWILFQRGEFDRHRRELRCPSI